MREQRLAATRASSRAAAEATRSGGRSGGVRGPGGGRGPAGRGPGGGRGHGRSRTTLSLEAILEAAISTLDREGAEKLTLRGLAAELQSGAASLYWYASGKEELLALASNELLGRALAEDEHLQRLGHNAPSGFSEHEPLSPDARTSAESAHALVNLRRMVLCLMEQMLEHRWLAHQLLKSGPDQENSLMFWEKIGQQLMHMELTLSERFHASLALVNYASGMGAEVSQRDVYEDQEVEKELFDEQVAEWSHSDPAQYPFVHSVLGEFRHHDDRSELVAGLDLLLLGLERQTWS